MITMAFPDVIAGAALALGATCAGAALVFAFKKIDCRMQDASLAFCAGMMAFSSFEMAAQSLHGAGAAATAMGAVVGITIFFALEKLLPHAHFALKKAKMEDSKRKAALMAGTVTLHNIPEGFAIAAAFASSTPLGWLVSTSIALQDVPEGTVVSVPVACYGTGSGRSFVIGAFSGLVEFSAAILGFVFLSTIEPLVPLALSFSAGAMAYVAIVELLPDAFKNGRGNLAIASFAAGALLAWGLAVAFAVA